VLGLKAREANDAMCYHKLGQRNRVHLRTRTWLRYKSMPEATLTTQTV
jgi:hypothetical protein